MTYSMYLLFASATLGRKDSAPESPTQNELGDALEPALTRFRQLQERKRF